MSILKDIIIWITDLLCISNYDRKVERKFWKMRHLYEKGGYINRERIKNRIRWHAKIGNDCLLCSKATIIGPVTIGDDVTIGACAIVTKDVPSHSVVKGLNQIRPKREDEIPEKYKISE